VTAGEEEAKLVVAYHVLLLVLAFVAAREESRRFGMSLGAR
jgi:hypothetical protein